VFLGNKTLTVGMPGWVVHQPKRFVRNLPQHAITDAYGPDVVAPGAIGRERNVRPIRAKSRLHIPSQSIRYGGRLPAFNRKQVEIA